MRLLLFAFLMFISVSVRSQQDKQIMVKGALVRGDSTRKNVALVFTADEWGEGLAVIRKTLKLQNAKASFFFTGRFYRNKSFQKEISKLAGDGHYLGPHSDQHLLYCDWKRRDSLLVSRDSFLVDISQNLAAMAANGLPVQSPHFFIPPYEWWNDSIAAWSKKQGLTLINFTPGIRTNADYSFPEMGAAYKSSDWILLWMKETLAINSTQFNGAIVLIHAGTDPRRKDKFYRQLKTVIHLLNEKGFEFKTVSALLMSQ